MYMPQYTSHNNFNHYCMYNHGITITIYHYIHWNIYVPDNIYIPDHYSTITLGDIELRLPPNIIYIIYIHYMI